MQSEERDLITGLFERLRPYDSQPRDPEAERLIADQVARQPSIPYLLTQTVLVQEHALKAAQARIAELEARTNGGSGFLGSAPNIGPWGAKPAAPAPAPQPLQPPAAFTQGGGFFRSALATAAGVAGGALLFEGLRDMFGHGSWGAAQASPLMPPDNLPGNFSDTSQQQFSSADLAQDDGSADDYDTTADDGSIDDGSGFDGSNDI
ncbi:MAG TPA: DUF2076 domain-containing protein [Reyranella sp.]|jgi:hypothetical protein|nr:DUF2076 domain-containing protein [Reyranella sp.]